MNKTVSGFISVDFRGGYDNITHQVSFHAHRFLDIIMDISVFYHSDIIVS